MDLKEEHLLGDMVNSHWYYRAKLAALLDVVSDIKVTKVLDVGAGSGYFSKALLAGTPAKSALCVDLGYDADRDEQVAGKPLAFRNRLEKSDADLVLMMDVIEHVEDDVGIVRD
jgi:2-polyprenyl-3-methyl-5-hydroxy-6-metoxy-1,4-benzoquinol methylase